MGPSRDDRSSRRSQAVGALTLLIAATAPFWFWRDVIADIAAAYRPSIHYYVGWAPWALLVAGVLFLTPVLLSAGRDPEGRFYPRARNAYLGWGLTLYLLGLALAAQVARIHDGGIAG